jgi:imidazolonepropionase-like amidohydrolase
MRFPWKAFVLALALALGGVYLCHAEDRRAPDLALVDARIYPSPDEPPIEHGSILLRDGRIVAFGSGTSVRIPRGVRTIDCRGLVVTAGFWNSHVHILTPELVRADKLSPEQTTSQLQTMLTRWGFTTVFDLASILSNTNLIRHRIAAGQTLGPRILTAGEPFWIKGGTPVYVKGFLEANHLNIPEVESAAEATRRVHEQVRDGADGIKIFANSVEQDGVLTMPDAMARSITAEAHALGRPVFAHVSNNQGIEVALKSRVDVLAHTTPMDQAWSPDLVARLVRAHMALTPTLTLWEAEASKGNVSAAGLEQVMERAAAQLSEFTRAGGEVLFGTDVGYTDHVDTTDEYKWMAHAGLSYQQILASLTTNPAGRFGFAAHSGRIARGFDADLVVLGADPSRDITAFSQVRYTIRSGKILYSRP